MHYTRDEIIKRLPVCWESIGEFDYFRLDFLRESINKINIEERTYEMIDFQKMFSKYKNKIFSKVPTVYVKQIIHKSKEKSENKLLHDVIEENSRLKNDIDILETMCHDLNNTISKLQTIIKIMESERRGV